jgi:hypothetical protein
MLLAKAGKERPEALEFLQAAQFANVLFSIVGEFRVISV